MKNTVQFGQNLAKLPEILFAHSSRNRHFEIELYTGCPKKNYTLFDFM
jgi:hypothetical protein